MLSDTRIRLPFNQSKKNLTLTILATYDTGLLCNLDTYYFQVDRRTPTDAQISDHRQSRWLMN